MQLMCTYMHIHLYVRMHMCISFPCNRCKNYEHVVYIHRAYKLSDNIGLKVLRLVDNLFMFQAFGAWRSVNIAPFCCSFLTLQWKAFLQSEATIQTLFFHHLIKSTIRSFLVLWNFDMWQPFRDAVLESHTFSNIFVVWYLNLFSWTQRNSICVTKYCLKIHIFE